jgi:hypothetical protein
MQGGSMPDRNTFDCDSLHRKIFELKNSNSAKQRIRLCERIKELEAEKAELIEKIELIKENERLKNAN